MSSKQPIQVYVPKGRRQLNEKLAQEEVHLKQSRLPVENTPVAKPKNCDSQIYIPKGRRELNEKHAIIAEHERRCAALLEPLDSKRETKCNEHQSQPELLKKPDSITYANHFANCSEYEDDLDNELCNSCILVTCSVEINESSRNLAITSFISQGAQFKWISAYEALVVFSTSSQTSIAMSTPKTGAIQSTLVSQLSDQDMIASLLKLAKELHEGLAPERSTRAANRMIGAALGIKVLSTRPDSSSTPLSSAPTPTRSIGGGSSSSRSGRQRSPPRVDAWDD